jgi:hypothetical protein
VPYGVGASGKVDGAHVGGVSGAYAGAFTGLQNKASNFCQKNLFVKYALFL